MKVRFFQILQNTGNRHIVYNFTHRLFRVNSLYLYRVKTNAPLWLLD